MMLNSLAPGKYQWNLSHVILNQILVIDGQVNIGSGNGLVPSGNKPLPEPMLTQISVAMWHHYATMS